MPVSLRLIKGRIKSIKSTRKITKAMELVSAAKMKKAVDKALGSRPFSEYAYEVLKRIVASGSVKKAHPLLNERTVKNVLLVVVTANRGLVGGLTTNLMNYLTTVIKNPTSLATVRVGARWKIPDNPELKLEAITVGKKGQGTLARLGIPVVASFENITDTVSLDEVRPIVKFVSDGFAEKKYDKVLIAYSDFISAVNQKPRVRQLLPVSRVDLEKMIAQAGRSEPLMDAHEEKTIAPVEHVEYIFEPSPRAVLDEIIPKIVLTQTYQAIVEARASEHSARMVAMKNASDNAKEIIDDLQSVYNQVRQAKITQEIAEISAGKAALE